MVVEVEAGPACMGRGGHGRGAASLSERPVKRTLALRRPTKRPRRASKDPSAWMLARTASVSADDEFGTFMSAVQVDWSVPKRPERLQTFGFHTICLGIRSAACVSRPAGHLFATREAQLCFCMRNSYQHVLSMLRSSAVLAAGPPGCMHSFSGARSMMLLPRVSFPVVTVCAVHQPWSPALGAGGASSSSLPAPPPARWTGPRRMFSTAASAEERRQATQRISGGAAGSDAASVAREIGRRAAERVKAAEPLSEDDWGEPADQEGRSPSQPSTSGRDRPPPAAGSPVPGQKGAALRGASSAANSAERSPAQNGSEAGGGGGDGRARRYLDRIAGLKAVPEDFNRRVAASPDIVRC